MENCENQLSVILSSPSVNYETIAEELTDWLHTVCRHVVIDSNHGDHVHSRLDALSLVMRKYVDTAQDLSITCDKGSTFHERADRVLADVCLPLLGRVCQPSNFTASYLSSICELLVSCFYLSIPTDSKSRNAILDICLKSLVHLPLDDTKSGLTDTNVCGFFWDIRCVIEVLNSLLKGLSTEIQTENKKPTCHACLINQQWRDTFFIALTNALPHISHKVVGEVTALVLVKLLKHDADKLLERLQTLWTAVLEIYEHSLTVPNSGVGNSSTISETPYILICGLADFYFPVTDAAPMKGDCLPSQDAFWRLIQAGLVQKNPSLRKRSMYLLKRIVDICDCTKANLNSVPESRALNSSAVQAPVFWWSPECRSELFKVWEDFILLVETLNEKQIHVIMPVFPRLQRLVAACMQTKLHGLPLLHTSWMTTVIQRAVVHESIHVIVWGVHTFLQIDPTHCPLLEQRQDKYITKEFLPALKETKLYCRESGEPVGSQPKVGQLLSCFLSSCWVALETDIRRGLFFCDLMETIKTETWASFPITFLTQSLARLPPARIWDKTAILAIREILSTNVTTMEQFTRAAIQCFLAQSLVSHVDLETVTPQELSVALATCNREESLQRGTTLWNIVASRLLHISSQDKCPDNWTQDAMHNWIESSIVLYLKPEQNVVDDNEALQICRMLLLITDSLIGHTSQTQSEHSRRDDRKSPGAFLGKCLSYIQNILFTVNSHAYMTSEKADRALRLLNCLLEECGTAFPEDITTQKLTLLANHCLPEVISYIRRRILEDIKSMKDVLTLNQYLSTMKTLGKFLHQDRDLRMMLNALYDLVKCCIWLFDHLSAIQDQDVTQECQVRRLAAMSVLSTVTELLSPSANLSTNETGWADSTTVRLICQFIIRMKIVTGLKKPRDKLELDSDDPDCTWSQKAWGTLVSQYLASQWSCLHFVLTARDEPPPPLQSLEPCFEALVLGSGESAIPVIKCLEKLLPAALKEGREETVIQALERTWHRLKEDSRKALFWPELEAFVSMAYQPELMTLSEDSSVIEPLKWYAIELFKQGEDRSGVVNVLVSQLCRAFAKTSNHGNLAAASNFADILTEACIFGTVHKRIDRTWFDVSTYLATLEKNCSANEIIPFTGKPDVLVRVIIVNFLTKLKPDSTDHQQFIGCLIDSLIRKHLEINKTRAAWNFANSLQHRLRHRLLQTLLILEPFIQSKALCDSVWGYSWEMLSAEAQPSVRYMLEWLLQRLVVRHHYLITQLWTLFSSISVSEKRNMSLCSLMCVVSHLGNHLPTNMQESYYRQAVLSVFPFCMVHHFNTRIHAQVALWKLWRQCHHICLTSITQQYPIIEVCLNFTQEESNSTKNAEKLAEHFIFSTFDPSRDYSIETIFKTLPRLTCLSDDEWILPSTFLSSDQTWDIQDGRDIKHGQDIQDGHSIQLSNTTDDLKRFDAGPWRLQGERHQYTVLIGNYVSQTGEDIETEMSESQSSQEGDIQKKIMPWRFMTPDTQVEEQLEFGRARRNADGLVLVTSLVDKIPNLGGLCRTSEIFGVSEFVINSLKHLNDKAFLSLSVTAHKWLPIREVKPFQLKEFLLMKRRLGYTLVGVEQTANSVSLTDFQFPVKTLLLLGHEKEGIPVDLIQLLDVCVEIPQQGVIRSLNVHVSGALFVWEYTRQQLSSRAANAS